MKQKIILDPRDIQILKSHVTHKSREFLITYPEFKMTTLQKIKYLYLLKKRTRGIPLAYLTKHKEFFGLNFFVNKHTLVPRPDTELMVEETLNHLTTLAHNNTTLIDIGTGSGCIAISILKKTKHKNIKAYAIDISHKALHIAKKNAKKHKVNITFLHGNLLKPLLKSEILNLKSKIIITANLPYLTDEQFQMEDSIQHEPKSALVAKNEGLDLYEKLLQQLTILNISYITCYFEIDPTQTIRIKNLIKKYFPKSKIHIQKDLTGQNRLITLDIYKK